MRKFLVCLSTLSLLFSAVAICSACNYQCDIGGDIFNFSTINRELVQKHEDEIRTLFEQAFEGDADTLSSAMCSLDWMTHDGRSSQGLDKAFGADLIEYISDAQNN